MTHQSIIKSRDLQTSNFIKYPFPPISAAFSYKRQVVVKKWFSTLVLYSWQHLIKVLENDCDHTGSVASVFRLLRHYIQDNQLLHNSSVLQCFTVGSWHFKQTVITLATGFYFCLFQLSVCLNFSYHKFTKCMLLSFGFLKNPKPSRKELRY